MPRPSRRRKEPVRFQHPKHGEVRFHLHGRDAASYVRFIGYLRRLETMAARANAPLAVRFAYDLWLDNLRVMTVGGEAHDMPGIVHPGGRRDVVVTDLLTDLPVEVRPGAYRAVYGRRRAGAPGTGEIGANTSQPDGGGKGAAYILMNTVAGRVDRAGPPRDPFVTFIHELMHVGRSETAGHPRGWCDDVSRLLCALAVVFPELRTKGIGVASPNEALAPPGLVFDHPKDGTDGRRPRLGLETPDFSTPQTGSVGIRGVPENERRNALAAALLVSSREQPSGPSIPAARATAAHLLSVRRRPT